MTGARFRVRGSPTLIFSPAAMLNDLFNAVPHRRIMAARASRFRTVSNALVEQRGAARHRVVIDRATVRHHGDEPTEAVLCDLSIYGCRLSSVAPHEIGERVWLRLGGGLPIAATVVWSADDLVGCRFDTAIATAVVRALKLAG